MEEKDITKKLENEVRAANVLETAKKAYQAELEHHLENEVRARHSVENARLSYEKDIAKHLENEVRARYTLETAHKGFIVETGKTNRGVAAKIGERIQGVVISMRPYTKYITTAAAACVLGVIIFQVDTMHTKQAGQAMYDNCVYKDGSTIDEDIRNKEYDQALSTIEEELNEIPDLNSISGEAKQAYQKERDRLLEQKAIVLLLQGKHRQAKAILKQLDTESAKKALDKLWW